MKMIGNTSDHSYKMMIDNRQIQLLLIINKEKFVSKDKKNHEQAAIYKVQTKRIIIYETDNDENCYTKERNSL